MRRIVGFAASVCALAACGSGAVDLTLRQATQSYRFEVRADSLPPHADEDVHYAVTVYDRKTEQPVQNGEGQIYAQLNPGGRPYTYDGFVYGPEVGVYHAKLRFVIAADNNGAWQMGLRFHRDSLSPIETINWQQQVLPERDLPIKK